MRELCRRSAFPPEPSLLPPPTEEFRMPLTVANLVRYMRLRGVAGDPADVQQFTSEDALYELIDRTNQAVFVKAFEPWCAHCFKMKRGFEAGATFFKGRVHFMEVQCSASPAHEAFCDKMGAERLPTLSLFTGAKVLSFKGSRAVAAYELFFHQHRAELPAADMGVQPAFPVESLTLTPQEAALIGHGYPIREEDVGVPDSDSPIITEEINAARNAVLRDLAEEAMADATVAAAGGVTVDSPPADTSAKAPPPSPAAKPRKTSSTSLQAASQALFMAAATGPRGEVLSSSSNEDLQARVAHLEKMVDHLVHLHALQQASEEE